MTFIDVRICPTFWDVESYAFLVSKSQYLQFASVNQRLLETKIPFVSIEKLFSEPKIGSNQKFTFPMRCKWFNTSFFVIQLGCISYFAIYNHKHQSARK
jgi:hypothetical protein